MKATTRRQQQQSDDDDVEALAAENEGIDPQELEHLLSDDDRDNGGHEGSNESAPRSTRQALFTESVLAILSKMTPTAGDECVFRAFSCYISRNKKKYSVDARVLCV
jgi:hypothetical protein